MTRQAGGCENERLVEDYASGKLSDEFVPLFEQHLDICSHCERLVSEAFQKTEVSRWSELIGGNSQSGKISLSTRNWSPDENSGAAAQNSTQNGDSALARYRKIRIAGAGGTGVVWEAWDTVMHRAVAIKILKPEYVDFHHTQRLLREAMAQARLSHAHLAAVHEFAEIDGQPAIVMDYVPGPTLSRCLQGQPIAESLAISLLIRMTSAIEHAHNAGIIHRDLKPSNIILRSTTPEETPAESLRHMEVKVLDFGTARFTDRETVTYAGQILGTPSYMSPEQVAGDSSLISERTDIYGLGAILYELLTGRLPFTSDDPPITLAMIRESEPISPRILQPRLSREIELICLKCLSKSPADRFGTATELLEDLQALADGRPIKSRPINVFIRGTRWCRRHRGLAALGLFSLLTVLVIVTETVLFVSSQKQLRQQAVDSQMAAVRNANEARKNADLVKQQLQDAIRSMDQIIKIYADPQTLRFPAGTLPTLSEDRKKLLTIAQEFYRDYLDFQGTTNALPLEDLQAAVTLCWIQQLLHPENSLTNELNRMQECIERHRTVHGRELSFLNVESQILEISARVLTKSGKLSDAIRNYLRMAEISQAQADLMGDAHSSFPGRIRNMATMLFNAAGLFSKLDQHAESTAAIQQACACYERLLQLHPPSDADAIQLTHYRFALVVELYTAGKPSEAVQTAEAALQFATQYSLQDPSKAAELKMRAQRHEEFVRIEKPNLPPPAATADH